MRFDDLEKESKGLSPHNQMARRLKKYIVGRLNISIRYNDENWSNQFRLLAQELGEAGAKRIWAVLDWLKDQPETASPFKVLSAKGFRNVFLSLLEPKVVKNIDQINVSPEASAIAEKVLRDRNWPYSSLANLPAAVQATIDGYVPLKTNLKDWLAANEKTVRAGLVGFVRMVQSRLSCRGCRPVETFCLDWFKTIHNEIKGWDRWSGDFSRFVFRKDVDLVNKFGAGLSFSYDGPYSRLWDWFKAEVWKS